MPGLTADHSSTGLAEGDVLTLLEAGPLNPPAQERRVPVLDAALRREYEQLFADAQIRQGWIAVADKVIDGSVRDRARYASVEAAIGTPWYVVAVIHSMESGRRFDRHLHNGDPLTARTTHVPAGRPRAGRPPFEWWESALDALQQKGFQQWRDWGVAGTLFKLEEYNGWGYRMYHPETRSPYLHSGSTAYVKGKYVADGRFDPDAVSQQVGAAVVLRRMVDRDLIPAWGRPPATPVLRYSGATVLPHAAALQRLLNQLGLPGEPLEPDGQLGPMSSDAFRAATSYYLAGDPRQ